VGDKIARGLLAHSVNLASSKTCGEDRVIRQNLDMYCGAAGTEDNRKLHGTRSRPLKVIRISARMVGMEGRLQIGGPLEKSLCNVEPSIQDQRHLIRNLALLTRRIQWSSKSTKHCRIEGYVESEH